MTSPESRPLPRGPWTAIVAILAISLPLVSGAYFRAHVVGVSDGDTITVRRESAGANRPIRVRLQGIDAPERRQPWGRQSKQALSQLVFNRVIEVDSVDTDRYGRMVARLRAEERDVGLEMVASGFAWHYTRYSDDRELARAERRARDAHLGLWHDPHAIAPWEFRQRERSPHAGGRR